MRIVVLLIALLTLPVAAMAEQSAALIYTKTTIQIDRKNLPPQSQPLPWLPKTDTPVEKPGIVFDVEVRDAMALYNQKGWFNLSSPDDKTGVLMAFSAPGIAPISASSQYAPLDILMIDAQGKIIQIVPGVLLSELAQDILPPAPVLAFLFLKGGTCASLSISPGDTVEYKLFHKSPTILNAPQAEKTAPEEKAAKPTKKEAPMVEIIR
jgi:uncharacterized membrane protein (UPF0127 family)